MTDKLRVERLAKVFGPEPENAVELARKGVSKDEIFKRTASIVAVDNVSFAVPEREIFVVMGLSGSGKSTLIRCLNRLIEPTSGHVFIDDEEVTGVDAEALRQIRLSKMAMVFQHFALLPHRTVAENAAFGLKLRGIAAAERRRRALEALDAVGLAAWADSPPDALSGGMQQRVGLARALAVEPEILLMDEPFSALDPLIRRDMQDELLKLQERYRTTIVFITHDLHEALKIGDQVAIMKDGVFVQVSGPEAIVSSPADDYVSAFVEDVDRSRVLTLRSVMHEIEPLRLDGKATIAAAEARFRAAAIDGLPVVDAEGRLEGVVMRRAIERAGGKGDLAGCFSGKGASASADQLVHEALPAMAELAKAGTVLSVVDDEGRVVGVVEPATVLGELGASSTPESRETAHG